MSDGSRWRVLVAALLVCSLAFGGCLTLDPTVSADTNDSAVFERISVDESWASQRVRATATLASSPAAGNVTQITVVTENGKTFSTVNTDPGQTSVVLELPANRDSTLVASDTVNGTTIEKLNVSTGGNKLL
ncbi:hypothetical protein [Halococcus sp. AFM35]|uniref:hypothetical protein n=1 Tax=Halococcus sp. AFM35 TaxID=3421653 RepID=UPI003EBA4E95